MLIKARNVLNTRTLALAAPSSRLLTTTEPIVLNFQDTKAAYASKSTLELLRSRIVLRLCSSDLIVDNNEALMKFGRTVLRGGLFEKVMKMTFYGQFVGGTDVADLRKKLDKMQEYGVKPILDYSVEADLKEDSQDEVPEGGQPMENSKYNRDDISSSRDKHKAVARAYPYSGEESCEANLAIFLQCLEAASEVCTTGDAFSAIKITGLSKPNALLEGSQFLLRIQQIFEEYSDQHEDTLPGFMDMLSLPKDVLGPKVPMIKRRMTIERFNSMMDDFKADISQEERNEIYVAMISSEPGRVKFHKFLDYCKPNKPLYNVLQGLKTPEGNIVLNPLHDIHLQALDNCEARLLTLADRAVELDAKLLIDAEQTYFQPIIDYFANMLMSRYNKEKVHIFNTYQCYLKDTPCQLISDAGKADALQYKLGAKLVRGAYMEQERQRALDMTYADPIYPNKALTNSCYHNMIEILLKQVELEKCQFMVASHNEFSIQYVVERMRQSAIDPQSGGVFFGQLLGMCDQVTYLLGAGGYCSYKYVPYGPVDAVLPYLSRRAYENKGMLQGSQKEIDLLKGELKRRKWGISRG